MSDEKKYKPQANSDDQSVDIKSIIFNCLSHWYLFVISVIIALIAGFFINRYKDNIYQTTATVLIKDDRSSFDPTSIMTNMSYSNMQNIENEMTILKSWSLVERVVKKMGIEVTYMNKGRIATTEMYKSAPFDVEFDRSFPQSVNLAYEINFLDNGKIALKAVSENHTVYDFVLCQTLLSRPETINIEGEYKEGEWINNGFNRIRIVRNDRFDSKSMSNTKMSFWLNSYSSLVKQMRSFSVTPTSKQSSIATIVMNGTNKQKIVEFVNMLMIEYINRGLEKKNLVSENTINFIDQELSGIQDSLSRSEIKLKDFKSTNDLMNLDMQATQVYNNLKALEKERAEMTVNVKIYKQLQTYIKNQIDDPENLAAPSTMGINDPLLNKLVVDLVTLSQIKATQLLTQTEQHPQVVKINEQIVTAKRTLLETVNNLVSNAQMGLDEINKRIAQAESEVRVLPEKQRQLVNFQRKYDFNDDTYKYLMQRRAEAQIIHASNTPDNEIIDEARLDTVVRVAPRTTINYLIALILGLLIPALYLFLKNYFNVSINDRKDIERLTDFPIIGQIPQVSSKDPCVVINSPKSPVAEAFRSIRTNIEFIAQGQTKNTILITSDTQGIGKTFNSINIASVYALYGKKTVLLGFDMRKPKLFQEFGLSNNVGLSSFLSNKGSLDDIIQTSIKSPNLDIITSGPIPPNPAELIASTKCKELFDALKARYDYIIIDTPPLGLVTDAFLLMKHSDVNLFIVRQGVTNKNIFGSIIQDLANRNLNAPIIINGMETAKSYGYRYGNYKYGYGYAYGYGNYGRYGNGEGYYGEDGDSKRHGKKKRH